MTLISRQWLRRQTVRRLTQLLLIVATDQQQFVNRIIGIIHHLQHRTVTGRESQGADPITRMTKQDAVVFRQFATHHRETDAAIITLNAEPGCHQRRRADGIG